MLSINEVFKNYSFKITVGVGGGREDPEGGDICILIADGNPLQCSCLENPRDGGAWWAAVYGVAQSRTRLKQLSSSSSIADSHSCTTETNETL